MLIFSKNQQNFIRIFAIKIEFRPVRRNVNFVDFEKCCKMRPWSQKSASIQKRTSPPKFIENRGSRMGVPGAMIFWRYSSKTDGDHISWRKNIMERPFDFRSAATLHVGLCIASSQWSMRTHFIQTIRDTTSVTNGVL